MPSYPITAVIPRVQYIATSNQVVFSYGWPIFEANDLKVYKTPAGSEPSDVDNLLVLNVQYTVSGVNNPAGGNVTLLTPANMGDIITIIRDIPVDRQINYSNGNPINADALNEDFDRCIMMIQDVQVYLQELVTKYQITDINQPQSLNLPHLAQNYVWQGGPNDTVIAVTNDCEDDGCSTLRSELANESAGGGAGAYIVGYYDELKGSTTVGDELDDLNNNFNQQILSILQFGATNDGLTDTTPALNSAYQFCSDNEIGILTFPPGTYRFDSQPDMAPPQLKILGASTVSTLIQRNYTPVGALGVFYCENAMIGVIGFSFTAINDTQGGSAVSITADANNVNANMQITIQVQASAGVASFDYGVYMSAETTFNIYDINLALATDDTAIGGALLQSVIGGNLTGGFSEENGGTGDLIIRGASNTNPSRGLTINMGKISNLLLDEISDSVLTLGTVQDIINTVDTDSITIYGKRTGVYQTFWSNSQVIMQNDFVGNPITDGYQTFPNGLIMQWLECDVVNGGSVNFFLPTPFLSVNLGVYSIAPFDGGDLGEVYSVQANNTLTTIRLNNDGLAAHKVKVIVIGR